MQRVLRAASCAALAALGFWAPASAEESWLDQAPGQWNAPGMAVPAPTPGEVGTDARCLEFSRPAETAEDRLVVDAGWSLIGSYELAWGVSIVTGNAAHDGMCRPAQYNVFVFAGGKFAGTVSPSAMMSRTDGAISLVAIRGAGDLTATAARYRESDPLCCPSGESFVSLRVTRVGDEPVLNVDRVETSYRDAPARPGPQRAPREERPAP
ncbi:MAG: LppP/LprE family lipoprotein [Chloroflexota bacterium]